MSGRVKRAPALGSAIIGDLALAGWQLTIQHNGSSFMVLGKRWKTSRDKAWDVPDQMEAAAGETVREAVEKLWREVRER